MDFLTGVFRGFPHPSKQMLLQYTK